MDARWATRLLFVAVALWLISGSTEVALAAAGEPLLPTPINMIVFASLSTATLGLLIIRAHRGMAVRLDALTVAIAQLRAEVESGNERMDHRDAALYRDFNRRVGEIKSALEAMRGWMMRPAIPRGTLYGPVATAVKLNSVEAVEEATAALPVVAHNIDPDVIDLAARAARRLRDAGE